MPPVSPLTIGLSDFLSQQRVPAATGALQGGPEGVKILQSLIAANTKQNTMNDPYTLAAFSDFLASRRGAASQARTFANEAERKQADLNEKKQAALSKAGQAFVSGIQTGNIKGFDLSTGNGVFALLQSVASKVGNQVTAHDILAADDSQVPGISQVVAQVKQLDPEQFAAFKNQLRKVPVLGGMAGPKPMTINDLFSPPKTTSPQATAAQAVSPAGTVKDAAYYTKHRKEFEALPKAQQQAVFGGK